MEVNVGDYLSLRVCMRAYYSVGVNKHQPDELSSRYSIRDYTGKERPSLETIRASSPEEYCSSRARWRPQSSWRQEVYRSCTRPEAHEISPRDLNVEVRRRSEWSDPWYREQYHTFWNHKRMPLRQGVNVEEGKDLFGLYELEGRDLSLYNLTENAGGERGRHVRQIIDNATTSDIEHVMLSSA